MTAYDLFITGLDTMQIAEALGIHEGEVEQLIGQERNAKRNEAIRLKRVAR